MHKLEVGRDAYAVFVGGEDRASDLYALDPSQGAVLPITYTAVAELAPSLSPDGVEVALLRAGTLRDSMPELSHWFVRPPLETPGGALATAGATSDVSGARKAASDGGAARRARRPTRK